MAKFRMPAFKDAPIEIRIESGELQIYATSEGINKLIECCQQLVSREVSSMPEHIHLEDYDLISRDSDVVRVVVAVFSA